MRITAAALWLPIGTILACLLVQGFGFQDALRYDRAEILRGELWRFVTCHLVHVNWRHLALNVIAFAILSALAATLGNALSITSFLTSTIFISSGLFQFCPGMTHYAGLSGLVSFVAWTFALSGMSGASPHRRFFLCIVVMLSAKLLFEFICGGSLAVTFQDGVMSEPMAHLLGAVFALMHRIWLSSPIKRASTIQI